MAYSRGMRRQGYPQAQSAQTQCSFAWDMPRSAYGVKCEYQPNFIEFIKAKIPASDRVWDPNIKTWFIKEPWFDVMVELAQQLWPWSVVVITRAQSEQAWKAQEDARKAALATQRQAVLGPFESALLDFCSLCDEDALKAAYRKMSLALHPDKGGDSDKMARLNAAWFVVESELRKKEQ
jgi:hypothetical protein